MPSREGGSGADNKKGYKGTLIRYKQTSLLIAHVLIRQMSTVDINTRCWHAVSWRRSWALSVLRGKTRGMEGGGELTGSRLCFLFLSNLEPLGVVGDGALDRERKALSWCRRLGGVSTPLKCTVPSLPSKRDRKCTLPHCLQALTTGCWSHHPENKNHNQGI